jgi:bifunctional DNase/RNase
MPAGQGGVPGFREDWRAMIEVTVESIRVSLINQSRLVVLRETGSPRFLPIWIGPFEAEAITLGLQGAEVPRPLTHDLLRATLEQLGASVSYVFISDLKEDTYFARIVLDARGEQIEVDSRTSDAIALAVRVTAPIYVSEEVMDKAGQLPAMDYEAGGDEAPAGHAPGTESDDGLTVFREFFENLDVSDADVD